MAARTIPSTPFAVGATVTAYGRNGDSAGVGAAPAGRLALASAVVAADASVAFDDPDLVAGGSYWAIGLDPSGAYRWIAFRVAAELEREPRGLRDRVRELEDRAVDVAVIHEAPLNIRYPEYGAVGDGVTSDYAALVAAYAAAPDGSSVYVPYGKYLLDQDFASSKRINVFGDGVGSAFWLDVGTAVDGITIGPAAPNLYNVVWRNVAVMGGSNSCRNGLVARLLSGASFEDVYVKCGTAADGWEVSVEGVISSLLRFHCPGANANPAWPYGSGTGANGIRLIDSGGIGPNANTIEGGSENHNGIGFLLDTSIGDGGNDWIGGTYQGNDGWDVHIKGADNFHLRDAHLEQSSAGVAAGNGGLRVENTTRGKVGPSVFVVGASNFVNADEVNIDGLVTDAFTVDAGCDNVGVGDVTYGSLGGAFTVSQDASPTFFGTIRNLADANTHRTGPGTSDLPNLHPNGPLGYWPSATTISGFSFDTGTPTKCGVGQADTTQHFENFTAKMTAASAAVRAIFGGGATNKMKGRWVTTTIWVYVPSGQGANQPSPRIEAYLDGGATIATGSIMASGDTDRWVRLSVSRFVSTANTSVAFRIRNLTASAGNWYFASFSTVLGRIATRTLAKHPNDNVYREPFSWTVPSVPAQSAATTTVTVQGAGTGAAVRAPVPTVPPAGMSLDARVTAPNTVTLIATNAAASAQTPGTISGYIEVVQ